jgi:Kef-type K+ transport system membrane component KefB
METGKPTYGSFLEGAKALLALLLVLALCRFLRLDLTQGPGGHLFALGFLMLAGTAGGRLAALIGLPRLTGYLVAGLLSSPNVFEVVSVSQVHSLTLVNNLALALIAFQAGCEFTNEMLQKNLKSLFYGTLSHVVVMFIAITAIVFFAGTWFHLLGDVQGLRLFAFSMVLGTLAVAKSPAAVVAILGETKAKGPLSDHALGIVVLLDVVVLALFSVVLVFANSLLDPLATVDLEKLVHLGEELLVSIAAGCTFGLWTILYFKWIRQATVLFIVASAYGVSAFCAYFNYDTMLVFVVAGYIVTNLSKQGKPLVESIESLSSVVMIVFFATAGASLHVDQIMAAWQLVLLIFLSRIAFTWVSAQTGHFLAKDTGTLKTYGFTPFISQAGLAIGLVIIVAQRFPGIGGEIASIAISIVALNEIVGPVVFKWGLGRAKEVGLKS